MHEHPCCSKECPMPKTRRDKRRRYNHMPYMNAVYMLLGRQRTITYDVKDGGSESCVDKRSSCTHCSNILMGYSQYIHAHRHGYSRDNVLHSHRLFARCYFHGKEISSSYSG